MTIAKLPHERIDREHRDRGEPNPARVVASKSLWQDAAYREKQQAHRKRQAEQRRAEAPATVRTQIQEAAARARQLAGTPP